MSTMSPSMSKTRDFDLTYAGVQSIWSSTGLARASASSPTSNRSQSTLTSDIPSSSSTISPREPIRQGSAAWTSLRNQTGIQRHQPAPPPPNIETDSERSRRTIDSVDTEYVSAVTALHKRRVEMGHSSGRDRSLPHGQRDALRKVILDLCGVAGEPGTSGEVDRYVPFASCLYGQLID